MFFGLHCEAALDLIRHQTFFHLPEPYVQRCVPRLPRAAGQAGFFATFALLVEPVRDLQLRLANAMAEGDRFLARDERELLVLLDEDRALRMVHSPLIRVLYCAWNHSSNHC